MAQCCWSSGCTVAWRGLSLLPSFGIIATGLNGWHLFVDTHGWCLPGTPYRSCSANKILKLGLMFFVLQCAVAIGYTSDNIVIAQVLGAAAVAAYAVPQKLFSFVSMVVSMGITPLWPAYAEAISRGDVIWVRRVFLGSLRGTLAISVPLCILLAFTGPWILSVAVGKSSRVPMSLLVVLAMWGIVSAVSAATSVFLNGAGVLKMQTAMAAFASLSNLALSVFLLAVLE